MFLLIFKFSGILGAIFFWLVGSPFIILGCVWISQAVAYRLTTADFPPELLGSGITALIVGGFFEVLALQVAKTVGEDI